MGFFARELIFAIGMALASLLINTHFFFVFWTPIVLPTKGRGSGVDIFGGWLISKVFFSNTQKFKSNIAGLPQSGR